MEDKMNIIEFAKLSQEFCAEHRYCDSDCPARYMSFCNCMTIQDAKEEDINAYIKLLEEYKERQIHG